MPPTILKAADYSESPLKQQEQANTPNIFKDAPL